MGTPLAIGADFLAHSGIVAIFKHIRGPLKSLEQCYEVFAKGPRAPGEKAGVYKTAQCYKT